MRGSGRRLSGTHLDTSRPRLLVVLVRLFSALDSRRISPRSRLAGLDGGCEYTKQNTKITIQKKTEKTHQKKNRPGKEHKNNISLGTGGNKKIPKKRGLELTTGEHYKTPRRLTKKTPGKKHNSNKIHNKKKQKYKTASLYTNTQLHATNYNYKTNKQNNRNSTTYNKTTINHRHEQHQQHRDKQTTTKKKTETTKKTGRSVTKPAGDYTTNRRRHQGKSASAAAAGCGWRVLRSAGPGWLPARRPTPPREGFDPQEGQSRCQMPLQKHSHHYTLNLQSSKVLSLGSNGWMGAHRHRRKSSWTWLQRGGKRERQSSRCWSEQKKVFKSHSRRPARDGEGKEKGKM
jgi:hypothetical protein